MEKIMISACLAGDLVRYDGKTKPLQDSWVERLLNEGLVCKFCPEVAAGMSTPRPPAQIVGGTGEDVLSKKAIVQDIQGRDVTEYFIRGAERALSVVRDKKIDAALLKEKSPSCGVNVVYDGSFGSCLIDGTGVTTALLRHNGVEVFSENEILDFKSYVKHNFPGVIY